MKLNFAILLLPAAASAYNRLSPRHNHHRQLLSTGLGTAPYGSGNGTATFGSSGLLSASTGTAAGQSIYSTLVVTLGPATQTVVESGPPSLSEAGATLPFPSSCEPETVTVTDGATVTVTVSAIESGASESAIPTQAPVPSEAGTTSPFDSVTAPATEATVSLLSPSVNSAITLTGIGAEPSSSSSTPALAETSTTVAAAPVVAPTSSTPAAPAGSKAPKRGVIASKKDTNAITAAFANTRVTWLGNWYSGPPPNWTPEMNLEYVPQMYSPQYIDDGSWASNAKKGVAAGDKYFMSFGEPDTSGMSADTAVSLWMKNMEPYAAQGVKLGAPGNLQNPRDMAWLDRFMDLCESAGCSIGFVCVHWFWTPGPNGQQDFKNAVGNATARARGKPVWVDNFGASGTTQDQIKFLTNIIPWLESNDAVERYGYLALNRTTGGFLPETGDELSDLGKFYATF